ncbi:AraC family transcriptional regulator ligand-binding domain-containing protein [Spongiibacter sp. KMU-158]|uniref:AraC family transcriptional regulator ligand-binding domain-containing protein n=1 Tax=Spongiibacter pelagi TaxID=2760804 RepID=A0A927GWZ1_9GAMM|nr:AraC family transcriptional regulator [Spongiibacter pelagi]MBD2858904.1 AraC family transcriptional regulator ligand-binding domain-containing protein [Spongiibacter pelagi]
MRTPTVCREYLDNLLEYLYSRGVTQAQLREAMRLNPEDYVSEHGRFPLRLFEMMLDAGSVLLGDYFIGAHAGANATKQAWGMVNYLGMSAPDSRAALGAVVEFSRLLIDQGDVVLTEESQSETATLVWTLPERQLPSRHVVEFFFASWYRVNKPTLDRWCSKREIHFAHAGPADTSEIERIIEAPVHYGSEANYVAFDSHFLDRPIRFPHPTIYQSLQQAARNEMAKLQMEDKVIRDVLVCIQNRLREGAPKLEDVAEELGLAPRTLQRRLNNTETNFKSLVDEARKERSRRLISDFEIGLLDISAELGFSDQSAFQKAFKRWFGQAPGRYRMVLQAAS